MQHEARIPAALRSAFLINFVWINLSEVARYFLVVRPMLHTAFPGDAEVAPMSLGIFAVWGLWDLVLIAAATGFYWLWLERFGDGLRQILYASAAFSLTVFGLLWLGVANMGLAPYTIIVAALPLAWAEQGIACWIVARARKRAHSAASSFSI
jgi:hypothetical protein